MSARPTFTRRRAIATGAAAATATLLTPAVSSAAAADHSTSGAKPTIVLVHGGFADASGWNGVISKLQYKGYETIAPANPLRGLPTDAPYIASVLASISGPIVLVGHSYGGAVITNAAAGNPNVKALVFIAAFAPDKGEQLGVLLNSYPGSLIADSVQGVPFTNPDGSAGTDLYLRADAFRSAFAADLPLATTRLMQATQRPFSASSSPTSLRPPPGAPSPPGAWSPPRTRPSRRPWNASSTSGPTPTSSRCRVRPTCR